MAPAPQAQAVAQRNAAPTAGLLAGKLRRDRREVLLPWALRHRCEHLPQLQLLPAVRQSRVVFCDASAPKLSEYHPKSAPRPPWDARRASSTDTEAVPPRCSPRPPSPPRSGCPPGPTENGPSPDDTPQWCPRHSCSRQSCPCPCSASSPARWSASEAQRDRVAWHCACSKLSARTRFRVAGCCSTTAPASQAAL